MHRHEPPGYRCPFCALIGGGETERNRPSDVVFQDSRTTAFVSPKWWERNPGHVLVVPNEHHENLYSIPPDALSLVFETARRIAVAIRSVYGCGGTSLRQHNEPGGNQDVWHFHVHVFPRHEGDGLYDGAPSRWVPVAERELYAEKLRTFLADRVWSATAGGVEAPVAATVADTATDTVAESKE